MKRETTNKIRYILEEILPPIIRDSSLFKWIVDTFYRNDPTHKILKEKILSLSKEDYDNYYKNMPEIHEGTDLSQKCIEEILINLEGKRIIDIGCGRGFLLEKIRKYNSNLNLYGTEIVTTDELKNTSKLNEIHLFSLNIERLDNLNEKFDTVICTHVLEHILNIEIAYKNLLKICSKKLIIIIPKERPYRYTFNGHIHFFPYSWSFINTIKPKNNYKIKDINRDFFYTEIIN